MYRPSILLVEDNPLLLSCMTSSLQREGYSVTAPKSIDEAMNLAAWVPFDVLITDWRLADGHDGFEVLERVRDKFPQTFAILVSAEAGAELAQRARAMGFDVVIEKPCAVAEIVRAIPNLAIAHQPDGAT